MKKTFFLIIFIFQLTILAGAANAMCVCGGTPSPNVQQAQCTSPGSPCTWEADAAQPSTVKSGGNTADLKNPIGAKTVPELVGTIIRAALGIVGSLALIMFIYGGFTWMLAAGNEQAVEKGKNILIWATVGLVVIFASYSLVNFVITSIVSSNTP